MFFARAINELFSKINRIDKNTGKMETSHGILIDDFKDLKGKFEGHLKDPVECTRAIDVDNLKADKLAQNGKIDRLVKEVSETRGTVRVWVYIFAGLIAASAFGGLWANIRKPHVPQLEALEEWIEKHEEPVTESDIAARLNKLLKKDD